MMNCPSKNREQRTEDRIQLSVIRHPSSVFRLRGFTLIETMTAVALLVFIGASVWLVMERCMVGAADTTQRMRAFEIARENMEKLLGSVSVKETTEYGVSEQFPDIRWQTTVETFYAMLSSRTWVRAVCSAEYTDSAGERKTVELVHWLTDLTDEQTQLLQKNKALQEKLLAGLTIESEELAAEYAGVNVETIREWVRNGMLKFNGAYLIPLLNLYKKTNGRPTDEQMRTLKEKYPALPMAESPIGQEETQEQPQQTETPDEPANEETPPEGDVIEPNTTPVGRMPSISK
jgi:hypothetical protein